MGAHDRSVLLLCANSGNERRAYPRFQITLRGICSVGRGDDETCEVLDLSLGGAKVAWSGIATIDASMSLLLPHIGLLSARVTRLAQGCVGVAFTGCLAQRRRVQSYLAFILSLEEQRAEESRACERIVPLRRTVEVRREDARVHMARIRDLSRSGVALTTTVAMAVGEQIVVGRTPAKVVRLLNGGAAAHFLAPLSADFDAQTSL